MSLKTTYILFAILAAMLVLFGFAVWMGPFSSESSDYLFPKVHEEGKDTDVKKAAVDRVEVEVRGKKEEEPAEHWVFERDPDTEAWRITQPREYRASSSDIDRLVDVILNARRDPTADPVTDLKKLDLAPPARVFTLKHEDKTVATLNVGAKSAGSGELIYVTTPDKPKEAMAVRKASLEPVLKDLADFRDTTLLWAHSSDIEQFSVELSDKGQAQKTVELKKASGEHWSYVKPAYGSAAVEGPNQGAPDKAPSNVRSALTDLSAIKVDSARDFVADDVSDMGKYKLGPKDKVLRLGVGYVQSIGHKTDEEKEKKTAQAVLRIAIGTKVGATKEYYYACREDEKNVVQVAAKNVDPFLKLLDQDDALRDRDLVDLGSLSRPNAITIHNSYGELEFRQADEVAQSWRLYRGDKDTKGFDADKAAVDNLVSLLTRKNVIEKWPDPKKRAELGLDKPDVTVSLYVDGLAKTDKKGEKPKLKEADKPTVQLRFGNKQGSSVAVERRNKDDKEGLIAMIAADALDQVRKGPLEYVSRQLPSFAPAAFSVGEKVTRLQLDHDGRSYELTHEPKADAPWKFSKPTYLAGRAASAETVENILRLLNRLHATEIVSDHIPESSQLDSEYGLKSPRSKVTLTVVKDDKDKKGTTWEYDFGKVVDQKKAVYARVSQSELIALVPSTVLDMLQKELQDPTLFTFDPAKVSDVKLTGWQDLQRKLGSDEPLVLHFQRKDSKWVAVKPSEKFNLDTAKLERLLQELSNLKAERFVAHDSKPTAEQGLDLAQGALEISLTVTGEKEPVKLTVGKADGDKGYYATTNRLPGDIVQVRKDLFDGPRSEPAYFRAK